MIWTKIYKGKGGELPGQGEKELEAELLWTPTGGSEWEVNWAVGPVPGACSAQGFLPPAPMAVGVAGVLEPMWSALSLDRACAR